MTGTVRSGGALLAGAKVRIVDGYDSGQSTTTNSAGTYTFASLQQGGFTIEVSEADYVTTSNGVTLTSNLFVDVDLTLIPAAELAIGGPITFDHLGPDNWEIHATAF